MKTPAPILPQHQAITGHSLTQDILKGALHYEADTGIFTFLPRDGDSREIRSWNTRFAWKVAGSNTGNGYLRIHVVGSVYKAHRLAFLYMTGAWPCGEVDHIDRNGMNNAWANLRIATRSQNEANKPARKDSRLGVRGVHQTGRNSFRAYINIQGKHYNLGIYPSIKEASAAYEAAAKAAHGEFARAA